MSEATMARAKATGPDPNRKPLAVVVKGSPEWKAWLEEGATHCRLSVSTLIDLAVARYLKSQGFDRKPPER